MIHDCVHGYDYSCKQRLCWTCLGQAWCLISAASRDYREQEVVPNQPLFVSTGTRPGQMQKFRDCPGHSGTLGNYGNCQHGLNRPLCRWQLSNQAVLRHTVHPRRRFAVSIMRTATVSRNLVCISRWMGFFFSLEEGTLDNSILWAVLCMWYNWLIH